MLHSSIDRFHLFHDQAIREQNKWDTMLLFLIIGVIYELGTEELSNSCIRYFMSWKTALELTVTSVSMSCVTRPTTAPVWPNCVIASLITKPPGWRTLVYIWKKHIIHTTLYYIRTSCHTELLVTSQTVHSMTLPWTKSWVSTFTSIVISSKFETMMANTLVTTQGIVACVATSSIRKGAFVDIC